MRLTEELVHDIDSVHLEFEDVSAKTRSGAPKKAAAKTASALPVTAAPLLPEASKHSNISNPKPLPS